MPERLPLHEPGSADPSGPVLCFRGMTGRYGSGPVVVGPVDAEAGRGELVALVGPNGAGKSTLLRSALGGEVRLGGSVGLCGRVFSGGARGGGAAEARWRARRLAWVPQAGSVRFGFSVAEVLAMGRHPHADAGRPVGRAAIASAVERCGVGPLLRLPFVSLSGGQQRRVLLARALAQADGGAVLLADEPTAGMDPGRADAAMRTLRAAADGGLAVVATLHDLTEAWRWADRVWLLAGGRLLADAPPEEVLTDAGLRPVYRAGFERISGTPVAGALRGGAVVTTA